MSEGLLALDKGAHHAFTRFAAVVSGHTNGIKAVFHNTSLGSDRITCRFEKCGNTTTCFACCRGLSINISTVDPSRACNCTELTPPNVYRWAVECGFVESMIDGSNCTLTMPFDLKRNAGLWLEQFGKDHTTAEVSFLRELPNDIRFRAIYCDSNTIWECSRPFERPAQPTQFDIIFNAILVFGLHPLRPAWVADVAKHYCDKKKTLEEVVAEFTEAFTYAPIPGDKMKKLFIQAAECGATHATPHFDDEGACAIWTWTDTAGDKRLRWDVPLPKYPKNTSHLPEAVLANAYRDVILKQVNAALEFTSRNEWRWK